MLVLPSPSAGAGRWRLPLSDGSAARLAEALLTPDAARAVDSLSDWLALDPALALWCVQGGEFSSRDSAPCLRDIARWLIDHAVVALQWPAEELDAPLDGSPFSDRAAKLIEDSVFAAEASRRQGAAEVDRATDPAYLTRLLHNAAHWSDVAAPRADSVAISLREMMPALPTWLSPTVSGATAPIAAESKAARKQAIAASKRFLAPGPLSATFLPRLMARLARQQQLETAFQQSLETEKLEAMAEFAAGAGHEINNPLAIIAGRAQLFLRDETDPERRRDLAIINVQAMRVYEMIADMMLFARPPQPELAAVNLVVLIEQIATELQPKTSERRITVECELPASSLVVAADATQLTVALRALIENALHAVNSDGRIGISARASAAAAGEIEIVVADSGPGISAEVRRHLFDPYYSGRQAGRGLGLGLSKCWRIVTLHGGRIEVESQPGRGATFRVVLPATREWKPDA